MKSSVKLGFSICGVEGGGALRTKGVGNVMVCGFGSRISATQIARGSSQGPRSTKLVIRINKYIGSH